MSYPELEPGLDTEFEPLKLPKRAVLFLKFLRMIEKAQERKKRTQQVRDAKGYEKRAAEATTTYAAGTFLLSAGRAYMNARKPDTALERLEEARPHIEAYKMSGTLDGFSTLSSLYQSLEFAYRSVGNESVAEEIHEKSLVLATEKEEHFGIHTEFLPGGGQIISFVGNQPEAASVDVIAS